MNRFTRIAHTLQTPILTRQSRPPATSHRVAPAISRVRGAPQQSRTGIDRQLCQPTLEPAADLLHQYNIELALAIGSQQPLSGQRAPPLIIDMGERPARIVQVIRNPCNRRIEIPHLQMLPAMAPVAVEATFSHHIEPLHRNPVPLLVSRQNQIIGTYPEGVGSSIPACKHLTGLSIR